MGDNFISLVPLNVERSEVNMLMEKVIDWLVSQKIIENIRTDCVLGNNEGYPPGDNYSRAFEGTDYGLLDLLSNGLDIITTRQVFPNGDNGLDSISCPSCGSNVIEEDWGDLIEEWQKASGNDKLSCPQCNTTHSIVDYKFDPSWGFGEFGLTFWNWPPFKGQFIKDLETVLCKSLVVVNARL